MWTFEGIFSVWPYQRYDQRVKVMIRIDQAAARIQFRNSAGGGSELSIQELIDMFRPKQRTAAGLLDLFSATHESTVAADMAPFLEQLAGPTLDISIGLPGFRSEAPGISTIKTQRRCESADFAPVGGLTVDFSDVDFSDVYFKGVDFTQTTIARTKFMRATLEGCQFGPRQLTGLRLDGAHLTDQVFNGFDFTATVFDDAQLASNLFMLCTLTNATFRNAKLGPTAFLQSPMIDTVFDGATCSTYVGFIGCDLTRAKFIGAQLRNPWFHGATLDHTSFKDAVLPGATFVGKEQFPPASLNAVDFDNTDLESADLSDQVLTGKITYARPPRFGQGVDKRTRLVGATFPSSLLGKDCSYIDATGAHIAVAATLSTENFKAVHAILPPMDFAGLRLPDADFTSAYLKEARFGNCVLKDAKFTQAVLESADFTNANLEGVDFNRANLVSAIFTQAWLSGSKFESSILVDTNFSSAMLAQVNFNAIQGRNLSGVNFSRACLVSADFKNVAATRSGSTRTNFSAACLAGTDFTGAQLADVILTGAQVATAAGQIKVSHPIKTSAKTYDYTKTSIVPDSTGQQTTCPDGNSGKCSAERLSAKPVPPTWNP